MELLEKDKKFFEDYKKLVLYIRPYNWEVILVGWILLAISSVGVSFKLLFITFLIPICYTFFYAIIVPIKRRRKVKKFLNKYNISKSEADKYYHFLKKEVKYAPLIQHLCRFNRGAKNMQMGLLKEWYKVDNRTIKIYFIKQKYPDEDRNIAVKQLKSAYISYIKKFLDRLFQLAILEDGIHNKEWVFLMQLIEQLQINKKYVDYFIDRYKSLRTEFNEYKQEGKENKQNGKTSKNINSVLSLKKYYTTLGLEENATDEEIRRAYHELALQHHPDLPKNAGRIEECEKMMMKINEAYEKVRG